MWIPFHLWHKMVLLTRGFTFSGQVFQIVLACKLPGGQYFRSFMKQMHKNKDLTSLSWVSCVALSYSSFLMLVSSSVKWGL